MPATFVIDHQQRLVRSKAWGVLVDADLAASQKGLREDKQFDPSFRQIWDMSEVTDLQLTGRQVQMLAFTSPFAPDAQRAVVVNSDVAYGMARMYALMGDRDPERFQIFRDLPSALRWLGVSDDARMARPSSSESGKDISENRTNPGH